MNFSRSAFLILLFISSCNTEEKNSDSAPSRVLMAEAEKLNKAAIEQKFDVFTSYTHPAVVQSTGGKEKFKELLERGAKGMGNAGVSIINITNGEPGSIIKQSGELQTTIPQTVELKVPQGRAKTKTTLIAISKDNGKTWHFVDTFQTEKDDLYKLIPTLSKELVIPPPQQPELIR